MNREISGSPKRPCHIVLITPYYWPILSSSAHLMKDLAEGLAREGCRVTVLTNGPGPSAPSPEDDPLLKGRILRAWNPFLRRLGVLAKLLEYAWFIAYFMLRGLAIRKVDIFFVASSPPLAGLPAALLARLKGAKLVYNLQDIFPDSAVVAGMMSAEGRLYRWLRKAEQTTYRVSDLVSSISPDFSEYVQRLVPGTEVATIPNWVDTDLVRPRQVSEDPAIEEFRRGGGFVVQYAGKRVHRTSDSCSSVMAMPSRASRRWWLDWAWPAAISCPCNPSPECLPSTTPATWA
jgi:colanic acid biosynthesis glycosyl transferase WcaI